MSVATLLHPPTFEEAVQALLEETADTTGEALFKGLARGVARVAGARYGLVGEVQRTKCSVGTRAVWGTDRFLPNFSYDLDGTPCDLVLNGGPCVYEREVATLFPKDLMLRQMGIEAYLGIEVRALDGSPLGIVVALHDEPLPTIGGFNALLRLFALRARGEFERGRAEAALQRSETRYRTLVSQSPDGICLVDPGSGLFLEVNDRFRSMTGYSAVETKDLGLSDLVPSFTIAPQPFPDVFAVGSAARPLEAKLRRKDGSIVDVEISTCLVELDGGNIALTTLRDVRERHEAQAAVLRLTNLYEVILRSAAEGIIGVDRSGRQTFVNPAAAEVLGYSPEELVGRPSHITWHHTTKSGMPSDPASCPILASSRDGEVRRVAADVFCRKDGTNVLVEYVASPIFEAGRPSGSVVIFRDISKEARLESIAEAVETMNSLGYVFSAVRHELGNPVNSVKMALSVLRNSLERLPTETVRSYVDRSLTELGRIEELLTSLRNFGLYDDVVLRPLEVGDFVRRFLDVFGRDYEGRGIAVFHLPGSESLFVEADPRALRQVLLNLFANAVDALVGRPDPAVTIRAEAVDDVVQIRLQDNGRGIATGDLADLFKPFRTTKASGTGLGLVIARKMMARLGGTIEIRSRINEGTEVILSLRPASP